MGMAFPGASTAREEQEFFDLAAVKAATESFRDVAVAEATGYSWLPDWDGLACIASPGNGGLGVRYVNAGFVSEGSLEPLRPQALLYAPVQDGALHLVAVEYLVLQRDRDGRSLNPPVLFGQEFQLVPAVHRGGLPAAYLLRAWVWQENPRGMFAEWHPDMYCPWRFYPARTERQVRREVTTSVLVRASKRPKRAVPRPGPARSDRAGSWLRAWSSRRWCWSG